MDQKDNINPSNPSDFFAKVDSQSEPVPNQYPPSSEANVIKEPAPVAENILPKVSPPLVDFSSSDQSPPPIATTISSPEAVDEFSQKRAGLKKILLILAVVLLFGGIAALFLGTILPRLRGISSGAVLTYWGVWEPAEVMEGIISEYQKSHPKVKVNYVQNLGESAKNYRERLQAAITRGEGPDIFRYHNTWLPMFKDSLALVPSSVMDTTAFESLFYPVAKSDLKNGSGYVGIPLEIDNLALFYNEDIFAAAGKMPPTTWEDFRKLARELTVRDSSGKIQTAGAALGITSNVDHWSEILGLMMLQNGASLSNPNDNRAQDALSYFTVFSRSDRVWEKGLPPSTYYFASGRLAMYFGPSWRIFDIKALNQNLKFKVISVPQLSGTNMTWASYWVEGVSSKSKYLKEAWEFMKYLSQKETMEKLYQSQSHLRLFGEPYSRTDMAELLKSEPFVGTFIQQAPQAKSWYLCSRTFDNGINDLIIKYYEDAVNSVNGGGNVGAALATVAQGVAQVLGRYGAK